MSTALGGDLLAAVDPAALAGRLGVVPDAWQADLLRSDDPRVALLCSRQVGKTTSAALLAVHTAVYDPGALVLLFAPSQRQALELFRLISRMYRGLGRPIPAEQENLLSLGLENGSRIVALPGDERTVRGYAAAKLLIIDEAARVDDEFYRSVRPMLAVSHGRLVAMSTPFGRRGWFYEACQDRSWRVIRIRGDECPRISPEFLAEERVSLGEWSFKQEYECEFVDANSTYFDPEDIMRLLSDVARPLFGGAS